MALSLLCLALLALVHVSPVLATPSIFTAGNNITLQADDVLVAFGNNTIAESVATRNQLNSALAALATEMQNEVTRASSAERAIAGTVSALTNQLARAQLSVAVVSDAVSNLDVQLASTASTLATSTSTLQASILGLTNTTSIAQAALSTRVTSQSSALATLSAAHVAVTTSLAVSQERAVASLAAAQVAAAGSAADVQRASEGMLNATTAGLRTSMQSVAAAGVGIGTVNATAISITASVAAVLAADVSRTAALNASTSTAIASATASIAAVATTAAASLAAVATTAAASLAVVAATAAASLAAESTSRTTAAALVQGQILGLSLNQSTLFAADSQLQIRVNALSAQVVAQNTTINTLLSLVLPPKSCLELKQSSPTLPSGVYQIWPRGTLRSVSLSVYCEMTIDGGGWTLVGVVNETGRPLYTVVQESSTYINVAELQSASFMAFWYQEHQPSQLMFHNLTPNVGATDYGFDRKLRVTFGTTRPTMYNFNNVVLQDCSDITSTPITTFSGCTYASHTGIPWTQCSFSLTSGGVQNGYGGLTSNRLILGPTSQPGGGCYWHNFDGPLIATNVANTFVSAPNKALRIYAR